MSTERVDSVEFASAAWMEAIEAVLAEVMAGLDTGGRTWTVSEEFTEPPAHLLRAGTSTIAWHFRVTDGRVEVGDGLADDGDLVTVIDYAATLPVARLVYGATPEEQAKAARLRAAAATTGTRKGDERAFPPELMGRLVEVHNRMAERTR